MNRNARSTYKSSPKISSGIKKDNYENDYYTNYRSDGPGPFEIEASGKYGLSNWERSQTFQHDSFKGVGPKGYKRSDNSIEEEVCEILVQNRHVDVENVYISVQGGVVKLSGTVRDRQEKFEIEDIAEHVSGVTEVRNEILVARN